MSDNRRLWVIDGSYLYMGQSSVSPDYQFDYMRLRKKLEEEIGEFFQVYYVNAVPPQSEDHQDAFHTWLKSAPPKGPNFQVKLFQVKGMRVVCPSCGNEFEKHAQKGVDVCIAQLMLTLLPRYDTLVLSSGDGDFMGVVDYVRNVMNKRVELAVFHTGTSVDLQSLSDRVVWIDDFVQDVKKPSRNGGQL